MPKTTVLIVLISFIETGTLTMELNILKVLLVFLYAMWKLQITQ